MTNWKKMKRPREKGKGNWTDGREREIDDSYRTVERREEIESKTHVLNVELLRKSQNDERASIKIMQKWEKVVWLTKK